MIGIPVNKLSNIMCDNNSADSNVTKIESVFKKKHLSVSYHKICESCVKGATRVVYKPTEINLANIANKVSPPRFKQAKVQQKIY